MYRFIALLALFLTSSVLAQTTQPAKKLAPGEKKEWNSPPPMTVDVNKKYVATLDTSKGKIVLELFAKEAPKTVNSFVFLAREGFYDGTEFHRVIPGFM